MNQWPGIPESLASLSLYITVINGLFVVKHYYIAHDRMSESFKFNLSMQAVSHDCFLPPCTCANDSEYLRAATTRVI